METRSRTIRMYVLGGVFWAVVLCAFQATWGVAVAGSAQMAALFAALLVMTATFTVLRIPAGRSDVSVGALVAYLSVPLLGVLPAVAVKMVGFAIGGCLSIKKPEVALRNLFVATGMMGLTVLAAGWAYHAAGGAFHGGVTPDLVLPYLAMSATYTVTNVLLWALVSAVSDHHLLWQSLVDGLRQFWMNALLFAVVGLFSLAIYSQLRLAGLLVVFGVLLAARFTLKLYAESRRFRSELAGVLADALKFKDPYTGDHSARVANIAVATGRMLGLSELHLEKLRDSALLHDIGKIAIPDAVLVKPGPLDTGERATMERHVGAGGELLEQSPRLRELAGYVRSHHLGVAAPGSAVKPPMETRIIAVADAFDAMTSDRPYRKALPLHEAVRRLREGCGTQFDPEVVDALLRALRLSELPRPVTPPSLPPTAVR